MRERDIPTRFTKEAFHKLQLPQQQLLLMVYNKTVRIGLESIALNDVMDAMGNDREKTQLALDALFAEGYLAFLNRNLTGHCVLAPEVQSVVERL